MSKLMKIILLSAYSFVLIKYLKTSLSVNTNIELSYLIGKQWETKSIISRLKKIKNNTSTISYDFKNMKRFASDYKFILKYTNALVHHPTSFDIYGQHTFIQNKCKYFNCFITNNKYLLLDIRNFDAILYQVENYWEEVILLREPHQKYIFVGSESSANYPLCDSFFNNYYNLTMTYKLDSDILWTYLKITDKLGNIVGPLVNMTWKDPMDPTPVAVKEKIKTKKKAAAWFVSNCNTKSNRGAITEAIQSELFKYGHIIDIYGWCGRKSCPKERLEDCLSLLESDYYFYLAFENSFSEDYVTERILYPLQYHTVPIVYGGADYSRFLPPNSYIDARKLSPAAVASEMIKAINNSTVYENYFKWHNYYNYINTARNPDICKLCQILNEESHIRSSYRNFLDWWNVDDYLRNCGDGIGRIIIQDQKNPFIFRPKELHDDDMTE